MPHKKNCLDRRTLFAVGSSCLLPMILSDCTPAPCVGDTQLDAVACREQNIEETAPLYITGAMIIGAALGAGFALALRGNPIVGAIGGALLVGGATATERYLEYRLEQANGDRLQMLDDIRADIRHDAELSLLELKDTKFTISAAVDALKDTSGALSENAQALSKSMSVLNTTIVNGTAMQKTYSLYQNVLQSTPLSSETQQQDRVQQIGVNSDESLSESHEFLLLLQSDPNYAG